MSARTGSSSTQSTAAAAATTTIASVATLTSFPSEIQVHILTYLRGKSFVCFGFKLDLQLGLITLT